MAFVQPQRVKETTTTTGTGNITLLGAVTGFASFNNSMSTSDTFSYCIVGGAEWEVGVGTLLTSTTFSRGTIYGSTNGGALVSFSAGTKDVFITLESAVNRLNALKGAIDLDGANIGAGSPIYNQTTAAGTSVQLEFLGIIAGDTSTTITANSTDVVITANFDYGKATAVSSGNIGY